jgi:hypothetical protein
MDMSTPTPSAPGRGVKTLAIRLGPEEHMQLAMIAQLKDSSIAEEIRQAIAAHVTAQRSAPELSEKAEAMLAEIERDASTRKDAVAALLGDKTKPASPARSRGRKTSEGDGPAAG